MGKAKVIAVATQKGGVAKTTTSINVPVALKEMYPKLKIAVLDLDPQGHVAVSFKYDPLTLTKTMYDVLIGDATMRSIGIRTSFGIDIFPSNIELSNLDVDMAVKPDLFPTPLFTLSKALEDIIERYDYIFIDCPPSLNMCTQNALITADEVVIPIKCEPLSTDGLVQLLKTINGVKVHNPNITIKGVVATMMSRGNLYGVILQETRKYCEKLGIPVFLNTIRSSVRISGAVGEGVPAIHFDRKNEAVQDYVKLTKEMFKIG